MPSRFPPRLVVRGPNISLPDGSPVRLRGFNLLFQLDTPYALPREDTDDRLKRLLPHTNVVRLVMLHWDDRPTEDAGANNQNDCSEVQRGGDGHTIRQRCLDQFDAVLRYILWRLACGVLSSLEAPSWARTLWMKGCAATRLRGLRFFMSLQVIW